MVTMVRVPSRRAKLDSERLSRRVAGTLDHARIFDARLGEWR